VLPELKMYPDEWPELVNLIQSVLKNSLSTRLKKWTPMQMFTEHAEMISLSLMLLENVSVNGDLQLIKVQNNQKAEKLSKAMTEIQAQMAEKDKPDRKAAFHKHNEKMHV
jgi:hypothetical protein